MKVTIQAGLEVEKGAYTDPLHPTSGNTYLSIATRHIAAFNISFHFCIEYGYGIAPRQRAAFSIGKVVNILFPFCLPGVDPRQQQEVRDPLLPPPPLRSTDPEAGGLPPGTGLEPLY